MDEDKLKELAGKKVKEGWIKTSMMIEVLAVTKEAAQDALKKHVEKMEREGKTIIAKKSFQKIQKVSKPFPNVPEAFSQVVELEVINENYDKLLYLVMNYGPSSIEILEPSRIDLDIGEAQGILNSVATMMHKFASMRAGGIIVNA